MSHIAVACSRSLPHRGVSTMNSSPPPPSFTLPPLNSSGKFPIAPDESPGSENLAKDYLSAKRLGKEKAVECEGDEVRMSMYVKLFDGEFVALPHLSSYSGCAAINNG